MSTTTMAARWSLLGALYFSQGLPFGYFSQALPVVLRQQGASLGVIGLTSLLALPWALKFLWAAPLDRVGARRSWIIALQLGAVLVLLALAMRPAPTTAALLTAVALLNLLAATQDIATDGLAVNLLAPSQRGLANGLQVAGYRLGMVVGGGGLLILHDRLGAPPAFLAMAALVALATVPVLRTPQPPRLVTRGRAAPFLRRPGARGWLLVLVAYKFGDAFATAMLRPFFTDLGLGLGDIGWLVGTVGFLAGLVGALAGGALVNRLGRGSALVMFGLLQAAAIAGHALAALGRPEPAALALLCAAEHLTGGMATAALFTCMMDRSAPGTAGADYTVQASAVVIATGAASALAGFSAQALGYLGHFGLATLLALAGVGVVARMLRRPSDTLGATVASCA